MRVCSCLDSHRCIIDHGAVKVPRSSEDKAAARAMSDILLQELNRAVSVTSHITHTASATAAGAAEFVAKRSTAVAAGAVTAGAATAAAASAATHRVTNSSAPRRRSMAGLLEERGGAGAPGGSAVAPMGRKSKGQTSGGHAGKQGPQQPPWWSCMVRIPWRPCASAMPVAVQCRLWYHTQCYPVALHIWAPSVCCRLMLGEA